jgi:hypothetical protein
MAVQNVFAQFQNPVASPAQVQNGLAQNMQALTGLQASQLAVQDKAQIMGQRNALRAGIESGDIDLSNPDHYPKALAIAPDVAPPLIKTLQEGKEKAAKATLDLASAGKADQETATNAMAMYRSLVTPQTTPDQWGRIVGAMYSDPRTSKAIQAQFGPQEGVSAEIANAAQSPQSWQQYMQSEAMGMEKYIQNQTTQRGQNLTYQAARENNIATNATHIQAANIAAATSRANTADTIKKDLTVAGLNPDGTVSQNTEALAQSIAKGDVAPLSGFALARPAGQQVMARVMQINPQYDATTYGAKVAAAKAFTSGKEAQLLRSIGTANKHLTMLDGLVDSLDNGDIQAFNRGAQFFKEQTGQTAPTNFDAVKDIVGQEVVKSIVAGGGSMQERSDAAASISKAKSPQQLKGVIANYRTVMGAQRESLLQQRRAAGLPDSTIPDYTDQSAPAGTPPGWTIEKIK